MSGFFLKAYRGVKNFFSDLYRAYNFRDDELRPAVEFIKGSELFYLNEFINLEKNRNLLNGFFDDVKFDVNKRYFSNVKRILFGRELKQDEEAKVGIKYFNFGFLGHNKCYVVEDNFLFDFAEKNLESKIFENDYFKNKPDSKYEKSSVNSYRGFEKKVFAKYIDSFSADCFTNKLATVSLERNGFVSDVADVLAGYVSSSSDVISPHKRSWKSRVSALEDLLISNNFIGDDNALIDIKNALSSNKYLITKRKEEYDRVVLLIDKVLERNNYKE